MQSLHTKSQRRGKNSFFARTFIPLILILVLIAPLTPTTHTSATYAYQTTEPESQELFSPLQPTMPFNTLQSTDQTRVIARNAGFATINLIGNGSFETTDHWLLDNWDYTNTEQYDGSNAVSSKAGLNGSLTQTMIFPEEGIVAHLSFWWKTSNPDSSNDTLKVIITNSDTTLPYYYESIELYDNSATGWQYTEINLNHIISDIVGKTINIRFETNQNDTDPHTLFSLDKVQFIVSTQDETIRLSSSPNWTSKEEERGKLSSIAWGDVDGDGDLDLAVGNDDGQKNHIFCNENGILEREPCWSSNETDDTTSIAFGDIDNDGDLDLAVGNDGEPNRIYLNHQGVLNTIADWSTDTSDNTESIAFGDVNGDGWLDLAVGNFNQPTKLYFNSAGELETTADWTSDVENKALSVAFGDVNGDGWLDLAVGNYGLSNTLYLNNGGSLNSTADWSASEDTDYTTSIAFGDIDNDDDLDLVVANNGNPDRIYLNDNGTLNSNADWSSEEANNTQSIALGDVDGDGDLDMAVGKEYANLLYRNDGNDLLLTNRAVWSSDDSVLTRSVAWGDTDNDGDLDLAAGNQSGSLVRLYPNENGLFSNQIEWKSQEQDDTTSIAFGDIDKDGDSDLVVGNNDGSISIQKYLNNDGTLNSTADWASQEQDNTTSIALGDMNWDGILDVVVGNDDTKPNQLYLSKNGIWNDQETKTLYEYDQTTSVALGDMNGDGYLDLAVGNSREPNRIYLHDNGTLHSNANWSSQEQDDTTSIAFGDIDNDGDLDLAVGNSDEANRIYLNEEGEFTHQAVWSSEAQDDTRSIAFGDIDGDGYLDLVVGNNRQRNTIYRIFYNDQGVLEKQLFWTSEEADNTQSIALGDIDGDGDLDLVVGNYGQPNRIYRNNNGVLPHQATWSTSETNDTKSVALGDVDGDGDLDLAVGNDGEPNQIYRNLRHNSRINIGTIPTVHIEQFGQTNGYASPFVQKNLTIPFTYTLMHPHSLPVQRIKAYVSLNGGDSWITAVPTNTITQDLATSPAGETHIFTWDVFKTGIMGQYDNVILRLLAIPSASYENDTNHIPGPFIYGSYATTSLPFRIRGTQVRVLQSDETAPISDTIVYRKPSNAAVADVIAFHDEPYLTDNQGYLQGRGIISPTDELVALTVISATESYTYYITNAVPTKTGLEMFEVKEPSIQTITISKAHPLLLFNLIVSLEWNAQNDAKFLARLYDDLQRTSELLFDWTDGQAALGDITIYHQREYWNEAHIRIYATNQLRPNANQGGIITDTLTEEPLGHLIEYGPGQVRMGATWNRYGDTTGTIGEDWPRTLGHELSHYAFFLDDNYLGLDEETGMLKEIYNCDGVMSDPYIDNNSEFHPNDQKWKDYCQETLSNKETGRSDWETINKFYPMLNNPSNLNDNPGPVSLPLNTIRFHNIEPQVNKQPILDSIIYLVDKDEKPYTPDRRSLAFLLQYEDDQIIENDQLLDLGSPVKDRIEALGARSDIDKLCMYDFVNLVAGCEIIKANDQQLQVEDVDDWWKPDIQISPVTSYTIGITVAFQKVPEGMGVLQAKLYPTEYPTPTLQVLQQVSGSNIYTGIMTLQEPALEGYLLLQDTNSPDNRFMLTNYAMGGNPGRRIASNAYWDTSWGRRRGRHVVFRSNPGRRRGRHAPISSTDGQAMVYGKDLEQFEEGEFYVLQKTEVAAPPDWSTVVGSAYRLTKSDNAPELSGTSLHIGYRSLDVVPGEEEFIRGYFQETDEAKCGVWEAPCWQPITTTLNMEQNTVSIPVQGAGTYALMSSVELSSLRGDDGGTWNNVAYPVIGCRVVTKTLASIEGAYESVWYYDNDNTDTPWFAWKTHQVSSPLWVNTLEYFQFGKGYWIKMLTNTALYLKGHPDEEDEELATEHVQCKSVPQSRQSQRSPIIEKGMTNVPNLYYGTIEANSTLTPKAGMPVTATINGTICGVTTTLEVDGKIQYALPVVTANSMGGLQGCGFPGETVSFSVDGIVMQQQEEWKNESVKEITLSADEAITGLNVTNSSPTELGDSTLFMATIKKGTNVTYAWDFGDDTAIRTSDVATIMHTYEQTGTYTAIVTANNSVSSLVSTTSVVVVSSPSEDEEITGLSVTNSSPTELDDATLFTATIETGTNVTYVWDFGDGAAIRTSDVATITHTYEQTGTYTAIVTASNSVSSQVYTTSVVIVQFPSPAPSGDEVITGLKFTSSSPTELGDSTLFTATIKEGTNVTYAWDFGDDTAIKNSDTGAITHKYTEVRNYTARVTATNSVGSKEATTVVEIKQDPCLTDEIVSLDMEADDTIVVYKATTFTAQPSGGSNIRYTWDFGDDEESGTITSRTTSHTYMKTGTYTVTVTASNGCSTLPQTKEIVALWHVYLPFVKR